MPADRTALKPAEKKFDAATFNRQVYDTVRRIPEGNCASYGQIAKLLGKPKHSRAVGAALKILPFEFSSPTLPQLPSQDDEILPPPDPNPKFVPWHRVVDSSGIISPRGSAVAINLQADWLRAEGVEVNAINGLAGADGGKVNLRVYGWEPEDEEADE